MALHRRFSSSLALAALGIAMLTSARPASVAEQAPSAPVQPPGTTTLLDSGAWCWYEDERALVDFAGGRLYVSAVANAPSPGEVILGEIDLTSGARRTVGLGRAELDDHNSAAIWESPGREVLTAWTRHGRDMVLRTHRRRTDSSWLRLPTVSDESAVTYNNLYSVLSEDGRAMLYDFYRGARWDPEVIASTDAGRTWSRLGRLLADPADSPAQRPYVRYASRGDRIDFLSTEGHPGEARTNIYHGYIRDGIIHTSAGTALGRVGTAVPVTSLTRVWASSPTEEGWTVDLGYDRTTGLPIAAFSTTRTASDHRYYIGRWDGARWQVRQVAYAGRALYPSQAHYTGLVALDPRDPNHIVISTDADPATGAPLISGTDGRRHWELFDGTRRSDGTYAWTPLTANSTVDNIRPVITTNASGAWALAWLRGRYSTFNNYSLQVVGVVQRPDGSLVTTSRSAPRRPVVAGINDPGHSPTPAVPVTGRFDSHPAADVVLYRPGAARDDMVIGDNGRHPIHARPRQISGLYIPVSGDYDHDGDTDIVWYAPGTAPDYLWLAHPDGTWASRSIPAINRTGYRPIPGDYDADGDTDILWYAPGTAPDYLWTTGPGATWTSRQVRPISGSYAPIPGDYDADGDTDILWYAPGTALDYLWTTQPGPTWTSRRAPAVTQSYRPTAGDLDGNGADDILWYAAAAPADYVWWSTTTSPLGRSSRLNLNL